MIKLQDFATQQGVTDRQVQRLLKKYESELEGLYERKGPNGTWLTDEACDILRSKMKQAPAAVFEPDPRVGQLQKELSDVKSAAKELWEQSKQKDSTIAMLVEQNRQLQLKADSVARLEADTEAAKVMAGAASQAAKEAQEKLTQAHEAFERDLRKKNERILAWERYAEEVEAYEQLSGLQKWIGRVKRPVPPVFEED